MKNFEGHRDVDPATSHLIALKANRNEADFRALFQLLAPKLKGFLRARNQSDERSEEIIQDVFVAIWQKADQFDPNRANASAWVFQMTRNKMIDRIRKAALPLPSEIDLHPQDDEPDSADIYALQSEISQVKSALKTLKPKEREMIEKAYLGEMTHSEIQDLTGLPLGTIKSRIRLGLEKLRHELELLRK